MPIRIQREDFDISRELAVLRQGQGQIGAVVSFLGTVRDLNEGQKVAAMELEHYPGMTEKALQSILDLATEEWHLQQGLIIHRVGPLLVSDQIVLVAACAKHRGEAFAACEFMMDYLKTSAPFWKKEQTAEGEKWVDARDSDTGALAKWGHILQRMQSRAGKGEG